MVTPATMQESATTGEAVGFERPTSSGTPGEVEAAAVQEEPPATAAAVSLARTAVSGAALQPRCDSDDQSSQDAAPTKDYK